LVLLKQRPQPSPALEHWLPLEPQRRPALPEQQRLRRAFLHPRESPQEYPLSNLAWLQAPQALERLAPVRPQPLLVQRPRGLALPVVVLWPVQARKRAVLQQLFEHGSLREYRLWKASSLP
jgi:hypothetical protein